uniref:50S ribosomal protein L10 n=1 Tax=Ditylum brightwellii TaxID=49249 RepID=A0A6V2PHN8_9STRA|mmetsp:Transcript_32789/g.43731  ORF Transcript_32789/g.43731 Transcript_32789/m.43731 type:complete len:215 (+) Transcript_32789:93-737(+)
MKQSAVLLTLVGTAAAFSGYTPACQRTRSTRLFGGAQGMATSPAGKQAKVAAVKELLDKSEMVFSVPAGSITVAQTQLLRRALPEGTTMSVVKNTLMQRAIEGTDYQVAGELLKGPNMWFFVEEDIGGSIKAFNAFTKENGKTESHMVLGGVIEGVVYDSAGVTAISKLPSKLELIAQIAGAINAVPTKVARVVKEPGQKLARAIKLATEEESS